MTLEELIDHQLGGYTDRPIFDQTGITGPYDFTLEFVAENAPPGQEPGPNDFALVTDTPRAARMPPQSRFDTRPKLGVTASRAARRSAAKSRPEGPPANGPDVSPLELRAISEQGLEAALNPSENRLNRDEVPESQMYSF